MAAKRMTQAQFVRRCRELQRACSDADRQLLDFLLQCRDLGPSIWKGYASFDEMLESLSLVDPVRLQSYRAALERLGAPVVDDIGVDAAIITVRRLGQAPELQRAVQALRAYRAANDQAPTRRVALRIVRSVEPEPEPIQPREAERDPDVLHQQVQALLQHMRYWENRARVAERRQAELEQQLRSRASGALPAPKARRSRTR